MGAQANLFHLLDTGSNLIYFLTKDISYLTCLTYVVYIKAQGTSIGNYPHAFLKKRRGYIIASVRLSVRPSVRYAISS